jgi:predicted RNA-binding protein YlqC (UPF0109 family)
VPVDGSQELGPQNSHSEVGQLKELIEAIAKSDLGKVIGRQGRTAESIRCILSAAGMKLRKHLTLEILD